MSAGVGTSLCRYGEIFCDCCDRSSLQAKWATYQIIKDGDGEVKQTVPQGNDCLDCVSTGQARHPGQEWPVTKKGILASAASKKHHVDMCKIRRGEANKPFLPESVWQTKKITGKWITTLVPKPVSQIEKMPGLKHPRSLPGLPLQHYEDGNGQSHECVMLKDDRFPDRLELTVEKSTEIAEFCFDGNKQLDSLQATEIYVKLRQQMLEERPERHFGTAMTWEQLQAALSQKATPSPANPSGQSAINAGPSEASVAMPDAETVSMVSQNYADPLAQRLGRGMEVSMEVPAGKGKRPSAKADAPQGKRPRAPNAKPPGAKKAKDPSGANLEGSADDPNYLKLPP